jgi:hypothetical protein
MLPLAKPSIVAVDDTYLFQQLFVFFFVANGTGELGAHGLVLLGKDVVGQDLVFGNDALGMRRCLEKYFVGGVFFEDVVVRSGMVLLDELGDESQCMWTGTDDKQRVVGGEGGRFWVGGGG